MAIVAGSLIFRPNRCVRIGRSCGRVFLLTPGASRPIATGAPRHLPSVEPQEQVSGFKEGRSVLEPSFILNDRSSALEVHAAHSAHTSTGTAGHRWALPLRHPGHHGLGP